MRPPQSTESLIDEAHVLDELVGVTNVPTGVWIDERGVIVRPPEVAHPGTSVLRDMLAEHGVPKDAPQLMLETLAEASKIRVRPEAYADALRDWAARGADSRFVLSEEEVIRRSGRGLPRPPRPRPTSSSVSTCTARRTRTRSRALPCRASPRSRQLDL